MFRIFKMLSWKLKLFGILALILSLLQPIIATTIPSITREIINLATESQVDKISLLFWNITVNSHQEALTIIIVSTLILALTLMLVSYFASILAWKMSIYGVYELRKKLFNHLLTLSQSNFDQYSEGTLITRFTADMMKLKQGLNTMVRFLFVSPCFFIWGLVFSMSTNLYLSISIFVVVPFIALGAYLVIRKLFPLYRRENVTLDRLNNAAKDDLNGIAVIKSYNLEKNRFNNYKQISLDSRKTAMGINLLSATAWPIIDLISLLGNVVLFIIIGILIKNDNVPNAKEIKGIIFQFSSYLGMVTNSIFFTLFTVNRLLRSQTAAKRYVELLESQPEVKSNNSSNYLTNGAIEFKNVSFKYPQNSQDNTNNDLVLKNINFKIASGQLIGIIGKTGSGKSTLAKLIAHEYNLNEGQILIDNININDLNSNDFYAKISLILQKPKLLSGSIRQNLTFVNDKINLEEINLAIDISNSDFIYDLDSQLDYELTQKGNNLSGGQKQRLSIAQGINKDLKILIIDDATSALDNQTDYQVRRKLKHKFQNTTMLIIAQRINAIKDADKIIVLDNGKLVGFDNHENLLKNNRYYQDLYQSQMEVENA
ncbi:ABC transporter ATP-binding protein [Mycoplasmopsis iners]|uniref:ABC transporter ATP-binding protein n=1 Tax=Mycoplasmopsis iners TaxID=76630 RepID=UPI00049544E0|nr:ABC transporter ATP-binding protein [Mycoplasmopsis iners]